MLNAMDAATEIYTTLVTKSGLILKGTNKGLIVEDTSNFKVPNLEFNSTKNASVYVLVEQKDGKILIGGNFDTIDDYPQKDLARINADGSLDENFMAQNEGFKGEVYDIEVLKNNNIIVGGYFTEYDTTKNLKGLIKLNQNGVANDTYNVLNTYNHGVITDILKLGKKLYIAGSFSKSLKKNNKDINGVIEKPILLLNQNGLDNKFNKKMSILDGNAFKIVEDKKSLIIVGDFKSNNDTSIENIIKVSKNGKINKNFKASSDGVIFDAKIENNTLTLYGDFMNDNTMNGNTLKSNVVTSGRVKEKLSFDGGKYGTTTNETKTKEFIMKSESGYSTRGCIPYVSVASKTRDYWYGRQKAYSWTRVNSCGNASMIVNQHFLLQGPHRVGYGARRRYNTNYLYYSTTHWFANAGTLLTVHDVTIGGHRYRKVLRKRF